MSSVERARIPVYFDRPLRPEWIDFTLDQFVREPDPVAQRRIVREYLAQEIRSPETLRKTLTQLLRYAGPLSTLPRETLCLAHQQMSELAPSARGSIRLRLLRESNPFLADCLATIQRLDELGVAGIEVAQMYDRMGAKYGSRGTIPRRVRAALETLAHFQLLEHRGRKWFVVDRAQFG